MAKIRRKRNKSRVVSEPLASIMADGSRLVQLVDSMDHLKGTQENQHKVLDEMAQQLRLLASSYDYMVCSQTCDEQVLSVGQSHNG